MPGEPQQASEDHGQPDGLSGERILRGGGELVAERRLHDHPVDGGQVSVDEVLQVNGGQAVRVSHQAVRLAGDARQEPPDRQRQRRRADA